MAKSPARIRTRLIFSYFFASLIPLTIAIILMAEVAARKLEDAALEFASTYSNQIIDNLNTFIDDFDSITKSLLVDPELVNKLSHYEGLSQTEEIEYMAQAGRMMATTSTLLKNANSISFLSASGKLYTYGLTNDQIDDSALRSQRWLQKIIENEDTITITESHDASYKRFTEDKAQFVTFSRKIFSYEHLYIGTLLVDYEPSSLLGEKSKVDSETLKNLRVVIHNGESSLVYDSQNLDGSYDENSTENIIYSNETDHGKLSLAIILPKKNLKVHQTVINLVAVLCMVVGLLLVVIISLPVSHGITKPILTLRRQMKLAEGGDYEIVDVEHASLEVRDLIRNYNKMITRIKQLINEVYLADIEQKNSKLLALQTQINPHMLFNTLETIRMKALLQKDMEVAEMVKALSRMFRIMLNTSKRHTLAEEISYTKDYSMLQGLRYPDMFKLDINMDESLADAQALPMIIQPIVENAFVHGLKGRDVKMNILVSCTLEEGDIIVTVTNDGQTPDAERLSKLQERLSHCLERKQNPNEETSIGLVNIAERIKLSYGNTYGVYVTVPQEGGLAVTVRFPYRSSGEEKE